MSSLLGHQILPPRSMLIAVTSTERTIIVSRMTPRATATPSWARNTTGMVPSTRNVAASTRPALVITPPVEVSATSAPLRVPGVHRLLAHAGHQEDVVVDAQGHEEHEREQREARVGPGEAEDVLEQQRRDAQRGAEGQHHGGDQDQRRQHRAQQGHQDQEHQEQDDRDDHEVVAVGGVPGVEEERRVAADEGIGAVDGVDGVADPLDGGEGLGGRPGRTRSRPRRT